MAQHKPLDQDYQNNYCYNNISTSNTYGNEQCFINLCNENKLHECNELPNVLMNQFINFIKFINI